MQHPPAMYLGMAGNTTHGRFEIRPKTGIRFEISDLSMASVHTPTLPTVISVATLDRNREWHSTILLFIPVSEVAQHIKDDSSASKCSATLPSLVELK